MLQCHRFHTSSEPNVHGTQVVDFSERAKDNEMRVGWFEDVVTRGQIFDHRLQIYYCLVPGQSKEPEHVLEIGLKDRDYLVGPGRGTYSVADLNVFPWIRFHDYSGVAETLDEWPNVKAWVARILERPAVAKGIKVPN